MFLAVLLLSISLFPSVFSSFSLALQTSRCDDQDLIACNEKVTIDLKIDLSQLDPIRVIPIKRIPVANSDEYVSLDKFIFIKIDQSGGRTSRVFDMDKLHEVSYSYSESMSERANENQQCPDPEDCPDGDCFCCCREWPPPNDEEEAALNPYRGEEIIGASIRTNYFSTAHCVVPNSLTYSGFNLDSVFQIPQFQVEISVDIEGKNNYDLLVIDNNSYKQSGVWGGVIGDEELAFNATTEDLHPLYDQNHVIFNFSNSVVYKANDVNVDDLFIFPTEMTSKDGDCGKISPQPSAWLSQNDRCHVQKGTCIEEDEMNIEKFREKDLNLVEIGYPAKYFVNEWTDEGLFEVESFGENRWKMRHSPAFEIDLSIVIDAEILQKAIPIGLIIEAVRTEVLSPKEIRCFADIKIAPKQLILNKIPGIMLGISNCGDDRMKLFGANEGDESKMPLLNKHVPDGVSNFGNGHWTVEFDIVTTSNSGVINMDDRCNLTMWVNDFQKVSRMFWMEPSKNLKFISEDEKENSEYEKYIGLVSCSCGMTLNNEISTRGFTALTEYIECILFRYLESGESGFGYSDVCLGEKIIFGVVVVVIFCCATSFVCSIMLSAVWIYMAVKKRMKKKRKANLYFEKGIENDLIEDEETVGEIYKAKSSNSEEESDTSEDEEEKRRKESMIENQFLGSILDMEINDDEDHIVLKLESSDGDSSENDKSESNELPDERPPLPPRQRSLKRVLTIRNIEDEIEEGEGEEIIPKNEKPSKVVHTLPNKKIKDKSETPKIPLSPLSSSLQVLTKMLESKGGKSNQIVEDFEGVDNEIRALLKEEKEMELELETQSSKESDEDESEDKNELKLEIGMEVELEDIEIKEERENDSMSDSPDEKIEENALHSIHLFETIDSKVEDSKEVSENEPIVEEEIGEEVKEEFKDGEVVKEEIVKGSGEVEGEEIEKPRGEMKKSESGILADLSMELDFGSLRLVKTMEGEFATDESESSSPMKAAVEIEEGKEEEDSDHDSDKSDEEVDKEVRVENEDFSEKHKKLMQILGKDIPDMNEQISDSSSEETILNDNNVQETISPMKAIKRGFHDNPIEYNSLNSRKNILHETDEKIRTKEESSDDFDPPVRIVPKKKKKKVKKNQKKRRSIIEESSDDFEVDDSEDEEESEESSEEIVKRKKKKRKQKKVQKKKPPEKKKKKKKKRKKFQKEKSSSRKRKGVIPKIKPFNPNEESEDEVEMEVKKNPKKKQDLTKLEIMEMIKTKEICYMNIDPNRRVGREMFNVMKGTLPLSVGGKFSLVGTIKQVGDWFKFVIHPDLMVMNYYYDSDEEEWIRCGEESDSDEDVDSELIPREFRGYNIPSIKFLQKVISKRPISSKYCIINSL